MTEHRYMTNEERIKKLKEQGLIFNNEDFAKSIFDACGYYNVINGYREPFLRHEQDKKIYIEGMTFEQIFSLYQFDMQLRNVVMFSMTSFEDHFKAVLSNLIAENYGIDQSLYLNKKNYKYRNVRNERYGFLTTLNTLQDLCNSKREPVSYYMSKYGIAPPWVLFKIATFGNVVVLSKYLKAPLKSELCKRLFKSDVYSDFKEDEIKRLLSDALSLFLEYRNLAAHGGRVYNHLPTALIREKKFTAKKLKLLLSVLSCFQYTLPFQILNKSVNKILDEYCHRYPGDTHRIEVETGLDIKATSIVWIGNGNIFHIDPRCSGAKNMKKVEFTEDIAKSFKPCKKCCKLFKSDLQI